LAAGDSIFPLEIFIAATPRALGASSSSKDRWKASVEDFARKRIDETVEFSWLDQRPVALSIYYFSAAPMEGDVDNIIKPIMDALIGVAYQDDRVVERVVAQKFEPEVEWSFDEPSEILSAALDAEAPVVYIRVDDDLAWRRN
jgi:crossover junction endodeoxyribonuclease RusA